VRSFSMCARRLTLRLGRSLKSTALRLTLFGCAVTALFLLHHFAAYRPPQVIFKVCRRVHTPVRPSVRLRVPAFHPATTLSFSCWGCLWRATWGCLPACLSICPAAHPSIRNRCTPQGPSGRPAGGAPLPRRARAARRARRRALRSGTARLREGRRALRPGTARLGEGRRALRPRTARLREGRRALRPGTARLEGGVPRRPRRPQVGRGQAIV
jgi:hypothetical protein